MPVPLLQDSRLGWGQLQLHGIDETDGYEMKAMSAGTNFGNPVPIWEVLQSLAIDGPLVTRVGWDVREFPVRLRVRANDGETHAQIEAALNAQTLLSPPPPLEWTSPLVNAAPAVFDAVGVQLDADTSDGWDSSEIQAGDRFWVLTFKCLPFARAVDTTIIPALGLPPTPGSAVVNTLDDCASLTGWTAQLSDPSHGDFGVSGGQALLAGCIIRQGSDYVRLVRTALTSTSGLPYLWVDVKPVEHNATTGALSNVPGNVVMDIDGVRATKVGQQAGRGEGGSTRYYFEAPTQAYFTELVIRKDYDNSWSNAGGSQAQLYVYGLGTTDTLGDATTSTPRQLTRQSEVYGSMPTRAAVRLYDDTPGNLGSNILIYTSSNTDWQPPLRPCLATSGTVTADPAMVSGGWQTLSAPTVYRFPASLLESGAYSLMARIRCATAGALTWQARIVDPDGATTLGSSQVLSGSVTIPVTIGMTGSGYQVLDIADRLQLPPVEVETDDYLVEITLTGTSDMRLDETWLFGLDNGALTWVQDINDGPGIQWLEVRSPELGAARPSVYGGIGAVGGQAACIDYKTKSFGTHRFNPGPLLIFTMTTSSLVAQCELQYFARFHTHPQAQVLEYSSDDDSLDTVA